MTHTTLTETLSNETVFALYKELRQIAYQLNNIRWQVIRPIENSGRLDLRNELENVITQAQIALDNLN